MSSLENRRKNLLKARGGTIGADAASPARSAAQAPAFNLHQMNGQDTIANVLILAAKAGDLEIVKETLNKEPEISIDDQDSYGYTALHWAGQKGFLPIVKCLLENEASVNIRDRWQRSPLHRAAKEGHADVVQLLLEHGSEVNARGDSSWGPLHCAAFHGNSLVVELLLNHGADKKLMDSSGRTAEQILDLSLLSEETKREIKSLVHIAQTQSPELAADECKKDVECIFIPDPDNPDINLYKEVRELKRRVKDLIMVRAELSTRQQQLEGALEDRVTREADMAAALAQVRTEMEILRAAEAESNAEKLRRDEEIGMLRAQVVTLRHHLVLARGPHQQKREQQQQQQHDHQNHQVETRQEEVQRGDGGAVGGVEGVGTGGSGSPDGQGAGVGGVEDRVGKRSRTS